LRHRDDFVAVLRRGRRATRGALVVHLLVEPAVSSLGAGVGPRVGLVVGRAVGGAVRRNEVSRRLRHLVRARLDRLPDHARLVIRALPAAGGRSSAALGGDLDAALAQLRPAAVGSP